MKRKLDKMDWYAEELAHPQQPTLPRTANVQDIEMEKVVEIYHEHNMHRKAERRSNMERLAEVKEADAALKKQAKEAMAMDEDAEIEQHDIVTTKQVDAMLQATKVTIKNYLVIFCNIGIADKTHQFCTCQKEGHFGINVAKQIGALERSTHRF